MTMDRQTFETHSIRYVLGKTWTTAGMYRETQTRAEKCRVEGCVVVQMETAVFFAVTRFRTSI